MLDFNCNDTLALFSCVGNLRFSGKGGGGTSKGPGYLDHKGLRLTRIVKNKVWFALNCASDQLKYAFSLFRWGNLLVCVSIQYKSGEHIDQLRLDVSYTGISSTIVNKMTEFVNSTCKYNMYFYFGTPTN